MPLFIDNRDVRIFFFRFLTMNWISFVVHIRPSQQRTRYWRSPFLLRHDALWTIQERTTTKEDCAHWNMSISDFDVFGWRQWCQMSVNRFCKRQAILSFFLSFQRSFSTPKIHVETFPNRCGLGLLKCVETTTRECIEKRSSFPLVRCALLRQGNAQRLQSLSWMDQRQKDQTTHCGWWRRSRSCRSSGNHSDERSKRDSDRRHRRRRETITQTDVITLSFLLENSLHS